MTSFNQSVHRSIWRVAGLSATLFFAGVDQAFAQTFGNILCNAQAAGESYPLLLSAIAYIAGAFAAVRGVLMLKKHAENPNQPQVVPAMAHLFGASFLIALPSFAGVIQDSLMGTLPAESSFGCTVGAVTGATGGLDVMMTNFVKNIHGPMTSLLSMISVLVGLTFIVKGLLAGVKTGTDPRAASPKSIIVHLVIGAILISIGGVLPDILMTLFGAGDVSNMSNFSILGWSGISSLGGDMTAANNAAKAILAFVQIVGLIAFLRGWLVVKAAIEGGGQATIPQGITFIVGGAMAINIDVMLSVLDSTFGTGIIG
ncbi:MAG TPA: hypothetical protein DCY07_07060 [Rhodospirillaceae bacterium]|nr:hypothetical protein [Rhodospirillaceae bacterium]